MKKITLQLKAPDTLDDCDRVVIAATLRDALHASDAFNSMCAWSLSDYDIEVVWDGLNKPGGSVTLHEALLMETRA